MSSQPFRPRPGSPDYEPLQELESRKRILNDELKIERKRLKAHGSFNLEYWTQAAKLEGLNLAKSTVQRKISIQSHQGDEADWGNSEEAKSINEQIRALEQSQKICNTRVENLATPAKRKRHRAAFMQFFTTSKMGLGITSTGAGSRSSQQQSNFRDQMIKGYNAKHPTEDWLWCPILGKWFGKPGVVAAHLFSYKHGQSAMDAIFGKTKEPELFSPRNGILVSREIEKYLDCGKIVIVPDLPDWLTFSKVVAWLTGDVRNLKIRLLDPSWNMRERTIVPEMQLKYKDLDNRRLVFQSDFRPAARYLYFHYAMQALRCAWQHDSKETAVNLMKEESGKPFWGTPGRYLPENMLLALVEELGHEYNPLLQGARSSSSADPQLLLEAGVRSVKCHKRSSLRDSGLREDDSDELSMNEEEAEGEEEEEDDDE